MEPLFILSSPRSFTSIVAGMIGMHPRLYAVPELHLLEKERLDELISFFISERQEKKLHGLRRVLSQLLIGEQTLAGVRMADRWLERRMSFTTKEIYLELIQMTNGLGFVDKSPAYSLSATTLKRLAEAFPASKFIHLVRHPIGQGLSMAKLLPSTVRARRKLHNLQSRFREMSTVVPPLARDLVRMRTLESHEDNRVSQEIDIDFQHLWCRMQSRIVQFLSDIDEDRQMTIRGEDFLVNPIGKCEEISAFLGIPWNSEYAEDVLHPELSPYACLGPQGAQFGNDINYLLDPCYRQREVVIPKFGNAIIPWRNDGAKFEATTISLASSFGYE